MSCRSCLGRMMPPLPQQVRKCGCRLRGRYANRARPGQAWQGHGPLARGWPAWPGWPGFCRVKKTKTLDRGRVWADSRAVGCRSRCSGGWRRGIHPWRRVAQAPRPRGVCSPAGDRYVRLAHARQARHQAARANCSGVGVIAVRRCCGSEGAGPPARSRGSAGGGGSTQCFHDPLLLLAETGAAAIPPQKTHGAPADPEIHLAAVAGGRSGQRNAGTALPPASRQPACLRRALCRLFQCTLLLALVAQWATIALGLFCME